MDSLLVNEAEVFGKRQMKRKEEETGLKTSFIDLTKCLHHELHSLVVSEQNAIENRSRRRFNLQ